MFERESKKSINTLVASPIKTRLVSVVSGKGGVGKSVLTYGLAERLSDQSCRVLIVDADMHCGNQHVLANLSIGYGFREFLSDTLTLAQAVSKVADGIDLLPSLPGHTLDMTLGEDEAVRFVRKLREQAKAYDVVLIDHSSGVSKGQFAMTCHSDEVLLVALPELTSISDIYGLYKRLQQAKISAHCSLLVNRSSSTKEAEYIRDKFFAMADRFIGSIPFWSGTVPEDSVVRQSVARQKTIAQVSSQSTALEALGDIARRMVLEPASGVSHPHGIINNNRQTADIRG